MDLLVRNPKSHFFPPAVSLNEGRQNIRVYEYFIYLCCGVWMFGFVSCDRDIMLCDQLFFKVYVVPRQTMLSLQF